MPHAVATPAGVFDVTHNTVSRHHDAASHTTNARFVAFWAPFPSPLHAKRPPPEPQAGSGVRTSTARISQLRCCPPSPALATQQLELAQRNSLSLQDPRTTGRPTDSSATQPPPRGLHAESGRLLSVFQLAGPAAPQDQHPHPKACHATAEAHTGLRSRPCVGGMQARAMNSSFSSICPRSTRRRNRIQPCASR